MYWSNNSKFNGLRINQTVKFAQKYFLPDMQQIHNFLFMRYKICKMYDKIPKIEVFS
jgi:hypothetical protein